ncbi:MAG: protease inhibitor I42 family protein [Deltaproteobacteria bacterium]|nr:protease inhibitor I42 family protein [Deltaproteobacteria bacterium]
MKRLLILMLVAAALTVAGCIGVAETYTDPGQTVTIGVNQEFIIALGSNQSTGYSWQESHDQTMLELVKWNYEEQAQEGVVGAGGIEYFRFKALKTGQTEITLVYQRLWEEEILEQKVFTVYVK